MAFRETITELMVKVGADISDLTAKFKTVERDTAALGRRMQTLGGKLSIGLTAPLLAFGAASVKAFAESEDAIAQVEAAIKSTGGAAGKTAAQLKSAAEQLMKISVYDDDEILGKVTANLLTFTNVAGESFDKAQMAVLNLSARLKTDLQSSAIMVGKALNDPIVGLTALQRAGVQLSDEQKTLVKQFVAVNDIASAQKIILGELETQFGGAAQAAAAAGSGPFLQLKNQIGELSEKIGEKLMPLAKDLVKEVEDLVGWFTDLDTGTQSLIVKFGLFATALGPVLYGVGRLVELVAVLGGSAGFKALVALIGSAGALGALTGAAAGAAVLGMNTGSGRTGPVSGDVSTRGHELPAWMFLRPASSHTGSAFGIRPVSAHGGPETLEQRGSTPGGPETLEQRGFSIPEIVSLGDFGDRLAEVRQSAIETIGPIADLTAHTAQMTADAQAAAAATTELSDDVLDLGESVAVVNPNLIKLKEGLAASTEQMRTLGADALLGLTNSLSMAVGQLVSLQGGFKEFFQNVIRGFQQMIAQIVAAIVKQQILNALIGTGGAASGVGALAGLGALLTPLLPVAAVIGGAALLSSAFNGSGNSRAPQTSMAVSGVVLRSGDIRFSVDESRARGRRIGG